MSALPLVTLTSTALGACVGATLALTGAGGAIIAVPLLMFGLRLSVIEAAPIGLLAVASSALLGAVLGLRAGIVRYRAAGLIAVAGMLMTPAGLWVARRVPNTPLTVLFAAVLAYVAVQMYRRAAGVPAPAAVASGSGSSSGSASMSVPCRLDATCGRLIWTLPCARVLTMWGAAAGFLSGLLGVGGGFVIVPALRRSTDLPMQSIVASSLGVIALVSMTGVMSAAWQGHMDWPVALPFAAGAVGAMLIGREFAKRLSGPKLQQGFAVIAGAIAVGLIVKVALIVV
nr:hypothetical protein HUO10_003181 [Paraburkholderia busanensis]